MELEKMLKEMKTRRFSESTIATYTSFLNKFFNSYSEKDPKDITQEEIKDYLSDLVESGYSRSTQNLHMNAIKFYYEQILGHDKKFYNIKRPRKENKLPVVLSKGEVQGLLNKIKNLKQKTIASHIYSSGLRVSEAIDMEITDIDSGRMVINIRNSKGSKDRQVPLTEKMLEILRNYYRLYRPKKYLFNGQGDREKYSATSIRKVLNRASKEAGITKNVSPHTLRHSYATHMLEAGIGLTYIQELLGHNNLETTKIYLHISSKKLGDLKNPLDDIDI